MAVFCHLQVVRNAVNSSSGSRQHCRKDSNNDQYLNWSCRAEKEHFRRHTDTREAINTAYQEVSSIYRADYACFFALGRLLPGSVAMLN